MTRDMQGPSIDLLTADGATLTELMDHGQLTSEELVKLCLAEIDRHNCYMKSIISVAPKAKLLCAARKLDAERKEKNIRSALHGLPILVKVCSALFAHMSGG